MATLTILTHAVLLALFLYIRCAGPRESGEDAKIAGGRSAAVAEDSARARAKSDSVFLARVDESRILGNAAAKVWVVEISDFQCPYCKFWNDSTYQQLKREYVEPGKVRLAYINFPLPNHRHARAAAEAAMCAGAQGKFWKMHDALFAAQDRWSSLENVATVFDSLASAQAIDVPRMRDCLQSGVVRPLVQADYDRSAEAGVQATPSFIIGEALLRGAEPISTFRRVIDAKLAASAPSPGSAKP